MNPPLRRPMVGLSLCFLAGTWAGSVGAPTPWAGWIVGSIAVTALTVTVWRACRPTAAAFAPAVAPTLVIGLAVVCAAWLNAALRRPPPADLGDLPAAGRTVQIVGTISDDPVESATSGAHRNWSYTFAMEGLRADTNAAWQPLIRNLDVTWTDSAYTPSAHYGGRWILTGRFRPPATNAIPAVFKQPLFRASVYRSQLLASGQGNRFVAWCYAARHAAAARLVHGIEDRPAAVKIIHSLLLGYRKQMSTETYRIFAATGTVHIFAISGSHIVILGEILIFALMAGGVSRLRWIVFLAPLLILFTIVTGMQPSAVRACIMALVFWSAPFFHRRSDAYSSLGLAAILILAVDPGNLFNLGFILSFGAVLGLVLLYPVCSRPLRRLWTPDPLQLPEARNTLVIRLLNLRRSLTMLIAACLAAWWASTPLTAYYFNIFSPVSLAGNLIALPLSFLIMLTGCLSLTLGSLSLWVADVFNHANAALVLLFAGCMRALAGIPGGHWVVDSPPLWVLTAFYLLTALLVWRLSRQSGSEKQFTV